MYSIEKIDDPSTVERLPDLLDTKWPQKDRGIRLKEQGHQGPVCICDILASLT